MKKLFVFLFPVLMLCPCDGFALSNNNEAMAAVQSDNKEAVKDAIATHVKKVYAEALANEDESVALNEYGSASFVDTYAKYCEATGGMGSIECNIWSQAQDVSEPKIEIHDVNMESNKKARVFLSLTNFGENKAIGLPLVLEKGVWKIDDIVVMGQSMKGVMQDDIKAFAE